MSSNATEQPSEFESVKARLAEIADAVDDENLPFDEVLDLYEEAVSLGLAASDLLEAGIAPPEDGTDAEGEAVPAADATPEPEAGAAPGGSAPAAEAAPAPAPASASEGGDAPAGKTGDQA